MRLIKNILLSFVIVAVFLALTYNFVVSPNKISGSSMYPTIPSGVIVWTDKISYIVDDPERGDVVIFKMKGAMNQISRVIAIPGDVIEITSEGQVQINNKQISEPYLSGQGSTMPGKFLATNEKKILSVDEYFVMSDNREHSYDSRHYGYVMRDKFIGKVE